MTTNTMPAALLTYANDAGFCARVTSAGLWIAVGYGSSENAAADAACAAAGVARPYGVTNGAVRASLDLVAARQGGAAIRRAHGCVGPRGTVVLATA